MVNYNANLEKGLSSSEAKKRLKQFGENIVFKETKIKPLFTFIRKFNSPLLIILIFASLISFFLGERINAVIILLMVFFSGILDFVNSFKSEKAVAKLISRVAVTATVIRDGQKKEIELKQLVPGDIIFLSAGDVVPADGQLFEGDDFFVNESTLTGESFPVEKFSNSAVFMGTNVITGFGRAIVEKTGRNAEFGRIAGKLIAATPETDFEKNIKNFSFFIMKLVFFLVCFVFLTNALLGKGFLSSFIFAVAIAIGLTPELLPVIMSISLSRGSVKMAKKEVVVKNLSSIQSFGNMNILCTDKTGTLTKDHIVLLRHLDGFGNNSEEVLKYSYLSSKFHTGVRNPFDNAIKEFKTLDIRGYRKVDEIPFDFIRRRDSMVVENEGERIMITKGAPEDIFRICKFCSVGGKVLNLDLVVKNKIEREFNLLSSDGFRVLGVSIKEVGNHRNIYEKTEENEMIFIGYVAFLDPPKETALKTIKDLSALGVEVKILTGDNELLAQKICKEINLDIKGIIIGEKLNELSDLELLELAKKTTIFARVRPEQKERIILNLKKSGQVVGYLGDGINDAPALKAADVGISVNNAVDVAKETADIVLLRKSLRVLRDGIIEGRKTFQNTIKYIMMGLSSNFGNMFSMVGASLFLPFFPMLPSQILLNNFFYDVSQFSLPMDTVDEEDIKKPSYWDLKFIKKYMAVFGFISSIFDFLTFGILFYVFRLLPNQFQTGWFIESIATQVFVVYIIRTRKIPFLQSWPSKLLLVNTVFVVLFAWLIPFTRFGEYFKFTPLSFIVILTISGIVISYLMIVQIIKNIFYKNFIKNNPNNGILK